MIFIVFPKICHVQGSNMYMDQFPEEGGNGHFVSFFLKSRALVWPNRKR